MAKGGANGDLFLEALALAQQQSKNLPIYIRIYTLTCDDGGRINKRKRERMNKEKKKQKGT